MLKNEEILIAKYYSYGKIIHKVVPDIYLVVVLVKVCQLTVFLSRSLFQMFKTMCQFFSCNFTGRLRFCTYYQIVYNEQCVDENLTSRFYRKYLDRMLQSLLLHYQLNRCSYQFRQHVFTARDLPRTHHLRLRFHTQSPTISKSAFSFNVPTRSLRETSTYRDKQLLCALLT